MPVILIKALFQVRQVKEALLKLDSGSVPLNIRSLFELISILRDA
jgi:hypothetical protein